MNEFLTKNLNLIFFLIVFLQLLVLSNIKFTVWPEMILYPYFLLNDFSLYKDIINPYFPLLSVTLLGFFKIFGLNILNLKILTWLFILFADLTVLYAASRFYKKRKDQIIALGLFILMQIYFGGNGLWFELMLTPFILMSLTLIYFYPASIKKITLAGFLFSLAVLIKQNVLLFLIPIILFLFLNKKNQYLCLFSLITTFLLGVSAVTIFYLNVWNDFFALSIQLPLSFTRLPGFVLLPAIHQYPIILFPLITLIPLVMSKKFKNVQKLFWAISFVLALQFAFPRYENFHLQVLAALSSIFAPMLPKKYLLVFTTLVVVLFSTLFTRNFHQLDRFIDSDMLQLSEKIKSYPSVYILNGPELSYFFAGKLPLKPWATNFPWYFEVNNFEDRFIANLKRQQIEYIVVGDPIGGGKYDLGNYIPSALLNYIEYNYNKVERFEAYTIWQRKSLSP